MPLDEKKRKMLEKGRWQCIAEERGPIKEEKGAQLLMRKKKGRQTALNLTEKLSICAAAAAAAS